MEADFACQKVGGAPNVPNPLSQVEGCHSLEGLVNSSPTVGGDSSQYGRHCPKLRILRPEPFQSVIPPACWNDSTFLSETLHALAGTFSTIENATEKVVEVSSERSKVRVPPIARVISCAMFSPNPKPSTGAVSTIKSIRDLCVIFCRDTLSSIDQAHDRPLAFSITPTENRSIQTVILDRNRQYLSHVENDLFRT